MIELQRTGFFREMPHGEATDPSLAEARNPAALPHEDRVAGYLDAGHVLTAATEPTRDVFDASKSIGPPHDLTDGKFVWPGDLAHYVRSYHVRLAGPFIEHMLAHGWAVPADVDVAALARPPRRPGANPDTPAGSARDPDLATAFSELVGAARDALASPDGEKLRAQLAAMGTAASRFIESLAPPGSERRKRIAGEADLFKATVNEVSTDAARAANAVADDLRGTLEETGTRVRSRLSSSLRALSDWLEKPQEERTAQARSVMSRLDAAIARQREAGGAAPDQRPSSDSPPSSGGEPAKHGTDPGGRGEGDGD
jgi:hypothetical protein